MEKKTPTQPLPLSRETLRQLDSSKPGLPGGEPIPGVQCDTGSTPTTITRLG
jgi:hypothetical protein